MDDDGQLRGVRQFHLFAKNALLHVTGRVVVEIVQSDFAPGDHLGVICQLRQRLQMRWGDLFGFVRMNADSGIDPIMRFGVREGRVELFRARPRSYGENCAHARSLRANKHCIAIIRELGIINVGVGIDQVHG